MARTLAKCHVPVEDGLEFSFQYSRAGLPLVRLVGNWCETSLSGFLAFPKTDDDFVYSSGEIFFTLKK